MTAPLGLLLALAVLLGTVMLEGGQPGSFLNNAAGLVVFGGTFAATLITFPSSTLSQFPGLVRRALFHRPPDRRLTAEVLVRLSERARREGLLALEEELEEIENSFLRRGVILVIDGTDPELVRGVLHSEMMVLAHEREEQSSLFDTMGGYAPTMGIIGTVMGLVNVLGHLSDPSQLGSAIAVAFIATFYGVASANLLWLPIGAKLKKLTQAEQLLHDMVLEGLASIQAGENPRILQERIEPYLPRDQRPRPVEESEETDGIPSGIREELQPGKA